MIEAFITRIVSNRYTVYFDGEFHVATAMGKLRLGDKPIVGDRVSVETLDGRLVIQKTLPRRNKLIRPHVANIDQVLIVMSAKEPDFSFTLVDRLIFLIAYANIRPLIIVSKADLLSEQEAQEIVDEYQNSGYEVILTGIDTPTKVLEDVLANKLSVLAGQSGVGKSSLLNRIDPDLLLNTQEISKALGRGKHTTRHNQLYQIASGWIADTPGFSSLSFGELEPILLSQRVPDFVPYIGQCRYNDCLHVHEPGCKIKEQMEAGSLSTRRYNNYLDCLKLIKEEKR